MPVRLSEHEIEAARAAYARALSTSQAPNSISALHGVVVSLFGPVASKQEVLKIVSVLIEADITDEHATMKILSYAQFTALCEIVKGLSLEVERLTSSMDTSEEDSLLRQVYTALGGSEAKPLPESVLGNLGESLGLQLVPPRDPPPGGGPTPDLPLPFRAFRDHILSHFRETEDEDSHRDGEIRSSLRPLQALLAAKRLQRGGAAPWQPTRRGEAAHSSDDVIMPGTGETADAATGAASVDQNSRDAARGGRTGTTVTLPRITPTADAADPAASSTTPGGAASVSFPPLVPIGPRGAATTGSPADSSGSVAAGGASQDVSGDDAPRASPSTRVSKVAGMPTDEEIMAVARRYRAPWRAGTVVGRVVPGAATLLAAHQRRNGRGARSTKRPARKMSTEETAADVPLPASPTSPATGSSLPFDDGRRRPSAAPPPLPEAWGQGPPPPDATTTDAASDKRDAADAADGSRSDTSVLHHEVLPTGSDASGAPPTVVRLAGPIEDPAPPDPELEARTLLRRMLGAQGSSRAHRGARRTAIHHYIRTAALASAPPRGDPSDGPPVEPAMVRLATAVLNRPALDPRRKKSASRRVASTAAAEAPRNDAAATSASTPTASQPGDGSTSSAGHDPAETPLRASSSSAVPAAASDVHDASSSPPSDHPSRDDAAPAPDDADHADSSPPPPRAPTEAERLLAVARARRAMMQKKKNARIPKPKFDLRALAQPYFPRQLQTLMDAEAAAAAKSAENDDDKMPDTGTTAGTEKRAVPVPGVGSSSARTATAPKSALGAKVVSELRGIMRQREIDIMGGKESRATKTWISPSEARTIRRLAEAHGRGKIVVNEDDESPASDAGSP